MQARELTQHEIEEGQRGINDTLYTATQVQSLVRKMDASKQRWKAIKHNKELYETYLREENTILYFNYPSLFQLHAEDRLDQTFFEMLTLKRRIEKNEITAEQGSAIIGQQLFQRFIPQSISGGETPVPRMSYEDFYKQTNNE